MKKFAFALVMLFTMTVSASAMSYEQARNEALFLTDKMAYELNLTEDQYEAAYEINLDYLLNVNTIDDLYGAYWRYRNLDLSYILLDWQYRTFCDAAYFYRPIYWSGGYWHFGIYARYPVRDYFYFGHPHFYAVYRGGHSWRMNGGHSWYRGRRDWGRPDRGPAMGMRDGFNRGDYRNGFDNRNRSFGNLNNRNNNNNNGGRTFGNGAGVNRNRTIGGGTPQNRGTFGNGVIRNRTLNENGQNNIQMQNRNTRQFGGNRGTAFPQSSTRTTVTQSPSRSNFGGQTRTMNRSSFQPQSAPSRSINQSRTAPSRSFSTPSRSFSSPGSSFSPSRSSSSFGGGSRSFGGGSSSHSGGFGGGSSHGSFGGHR